MRQGFRAVGTAGALILALGTHNAWSQAGAKDAAPRYPERPIRMLIAFAPGGNTDILARAVGARMTDNWGKPVVVDNRPGGAGVLATEIVVRSAPDGHTVLVASTGEVAINPGLFKAKLPYNVERDLAPVSLGTVSALLLVAHPTFPVRDVKQLIALGKAKPRTHAYASVGVGSPMHLSGELFKMITGTDFIHVPYKGGAPATTALISGQEAQFGFVGMGPVLPHVQAKRLRSLAISTTKRATLLPDVPTMREAGVEDFDTSIWFAFLVPAKTPRSIIAKLNAELNRILRLPDTRDYLLKTGVEVAPSTPDELGRFVRAETEKYARIMQVSGTKVD
ncbi:MAG: Bug family tripartite tricarboxylate transporter substrate binding protein [Betaproteobacteria bacterium]